MALVLKSKTPVRFELSDGVVETTVTLYGDDSEQVLVEKLSRVVALAQDEPAPPAARPGGGITTPLPPGTNGWAAAVPAKAPELPEDRRADWEYMPAEGDDPPPAVS